jgi:hypothetical protein
MKNLIFKKAASPRENWSGRRDSNSRPSGPKPDALARLRYAPKKIKQNRKRNFLERKFLEKESV